jgi:RNA polymerase sigma-70 factor (ECF subfamily)
MRRRCPCVLGVQATLSDVTPSGPADFEPVLAAARLGQAWALSALFQVYSRPVAGYVRAHSPAEPDDVVSEVFTAAFTSLDRFTGGEPEFRAWLFTIARRRVVDDLRRRARRVETTSYDPERDARTVASAEDDSLQRVGADWARGVLDRLAPDQGEVLLLRVFGDLTVEQVATTLGKSTGAVKQLQRRGLAAARRLLEAEGGVPL